jgi:L-asparaginase
VSGKGNVLVIYTGGTIGMVNRVRDNPASPLVPIQSEPQLLDDVPALKKLQVEVGFVLEPLRDSDGSQIKAIDSSDINVEHWVAIAKQIEREYEKYSGFVILHGTDTMAYTASALSFMLMHLAKPVVITGSQIPIVEAINDGLWNFGAAVRIAGYRETGLPKVPEVTICFSDHLFRGNRVRKMSTKAQQGFDTPNYQVLGDVTPAGIHIYPDRIMSAPDNTRYPFRAIKSLDTRVLDFGLVPSLNTKALQTILEMDDVQGMVLRTFGAGNAPADENRPDKSQPGLVAVLEQAVQAGKVIVNVTPCPEGQVEAGQYAASSALLEAGVISGLDMTPEAALTKLMWLLKAEGADPDEVRIQMQIGQRGELTESLVEAKYPEVAEGTHGAVTVTARPQGNFAIENLTRAVLRISELKVGGDAKLNDDDAPRVNVGVFINNTDPTSYDDATRAGQLSSKAPFADVAEGIRRNVEPGRNISITLMAADGSEITFKSMALALFSHARDTQ